MGAQLAKIFDEAQKTGGAAAKMRLAMKTGMSSDKAAQEADSPEMVQKFKSAWDEVKKTL